MINNLKILCFVLAVFFLISACDRGNEPVKSQVEMVSAPVESPETLIKDFAAGFYRFNPDVAVDNGLHDYDGKLPDYSTEGINERISWFKHMRERLRAIDTGQLNDRQALHLQQMEVVIDSVLFAIEDMRAFENNPWFAYSGIDPDLYLAREYAPLAERLVAYITHVRAIPAAVKQIKNNLRPMASTHVQLWKMFASGLAEYVTTYPPQLFVEVNDPVQLQYMRTADSAAAEALNGLAQWVVEQPVNENFPLGEERYAKMLWVTERIDTPLSELKEIAQGDLQHNLDALDASCEEFLPGSALAECLSRVSSNKPTGGPVQAATQQLTMLRQIVLDKGIVTIPSDDDAIVAEAPPHRRANSAYISRPGPYEKAVPAIYYIAPPDPDWSEEEQYQYIPGEKDLLQTSIHEVWPGHFLEGLHTNRSGNPISELESSYTFTEGWAHYAEEMMTEVGLENDPETRIGQLLNALLRDVRFISSLGLHTGGMTVSESERLFLEKAYLDPGNARQQAARGTFDPGYLFYTVGKLMIKKLRDDWLVLYPDKTLSDFHDSFLSFGAAPVALIRKQMLGDEDDGRLFSVKTSH